MEIRVKKTLKKIKSNFVKKVTLYEMNDQGDFIEYKLKLKNFWKLNRKMRVHIMNEKMIESLPHSVNKNILTINLPKDLLDSIDHKATIKVYANNKEMWIKPSEGFYDSPNTFLGKGKYFITTVNKGVILKNRYPEYDFAAEKIMTRVNVAHYNSMKFEYQVDARDEDEIEVYAFRGAKLRVIDGEIKNNTIEINDFSLFSRGKWQLFIKQNNVLHPLGMEEVRDDVFNSYHHKVQITNDHGNFYLVFKPHRFECRSVVFEKDPQNHIKVQIQPQQDVVNSDYQLVMNNINSHEEMYYRLEEASNSLVTHIPMHDLYDTLINKRFFIVQNEEEPIKSQFELKPGSVEGTSSFREKVHSQIVRSSFYIRKDASLGFKIKAPKLRRQVTKIENFNVSGYIGSLTEFVDCRAYLYIQERNSQEAEKVSIDSIFNVDLKSLDLFKLKSKGKTIFDFFVVLLNQENDIIRKEKIKYKYADYKKDNYYDYISILDNNRNEHHFLITTTPFNNLKIETFTIPNNISIPADTSVKDSNVWLIGERYNTAQDNGIVLFNWLQENTDIEAYYVIEGDSPDYEKIKHNPNVLIFGSQKHFNIAVKAKVLLGTHDLENILPYKPAKGFFHYENTYKVFLQHGVLGRKNVEYHKKYYDLPFDLVIVSSDPEKYDVVMDELGYDEDEVVVTGLARFDNLVQTKKPKDILLMPTWRDWINTDQKFLESEYYAAYSNLINNQYLMNLLEEYDVNLNFYPHYRAQDYFQEGMTDLSRRIKFIPLGANTVQELLIDHALLITDYSTVSFDFLLMNKPVVYYHFDVKRFFRNGILRPIEETFIGKIAKTEEEIITLIEDRIVNNFENYDVDISKVIKYQDTSNSERIYKAVYSNVKQ